MTRKFYLWLFIVFFAGAGSASAADTRYAFARDQASIAVPPGVEIQPSATLPPNNEMLRAVRNGKRILGIYAGNYPDIKSFANQTATKETIGGYLALTYHPSGGNGRSRQTIVEFRDDGFPNVVHFFYSGATEEEAGIADAIIESLQSKAAPAKAAPAGQK